MTTILAPAPFADLAAPPGADTVLGRTRAAFGFLPDLAGLKALSPVALAGYLDGLDAFARTSLPAPEQQLVLLTASVENACAYAVAVHSALAGAAGLPGSVVEAVRAGEPLPTDQPARLEALRGFTRAVVARRGHLEAGEVAAFLAAGFTPAHVVEVCFGVGVKTFTHTLQNLAQVPLDGELAALRWEATPVTRPHDADLT